MIRESVKMVLRESDYQVPDNIDIDHEREWDFYDDYNGTEEYEKLAKKAGKMPKGYDKNIPSDTYEGGNTVDKLMFLNDPYSQTPIHKKAENDASWEAIGKEYGKKRKELGHDVYDMSYDNFNDYIDKTINADPNFGPDLTTKYVATESIVRGIVQEAVNSALNEMGTPRQNELLYKLTGSHEYDNLPVKDASKKIESLLNSRPKQPMTEKQIAYLQKLKLKHQSIDEKINLGWLVDKVLENADKIDINLGSKVIGYIKSTIRGETSRYNPPGFWDWLTSEGYGLIDEINKAIGSNSNNW